MTSTTIRPAETRTLDVPGATLTYDVHGDLASATADAPPLFLIGTPMGAEGFVTVAGHLTDRPVITYDPRNVGRSHRSTEATPTPEDHADDVHAIIEAVLPEAGVERVDVFGSSGGAINSLALAARHAEVLRVVVPHEPPSTPVLPDAEVLVAACADILASYQRAGFGVGMAKFILLVSHDGPISADFLDQPDPDPAMFGLPAADDGSRDDPLMNNMATIPVWGPDIEAIRQADCRVVLAVGEESGGTMAARAPREIAARLGAEAVIFPGGHTGFSGDKYGMPGKPEEFAAKLREVLAG